MPIKPTKSLKKAGYGKNRIDSAQSFEELADIMNQDYAAGTGAQFRYVPSESNDGTGEFWILRAPSISNKNEKRTGKEYQPIRIKVDSARLRGHHGEQNVINFRGKMITDEFTFRADDPKASEDDDVFSARSWNKRSAFGVAGSIIIAALGDDAEKTRKDFAVRAGYMTDPYASFGSRLSFKRMAEVGDNILNVAANTVGIRMPGSWAADEKDGKNRWQKNLERVASRMGFQPMTFGGVIPGSNQNLSKASQVPIEDLIGTNNVQQSTHYAYSAGGFDPKTGKFYGPSNTGRITRDAGKTYSSGYAKDPTNEEERVKVAKKEVDRAKLSQRKQYMPDDNKRTPIERYKTDGDDRMNKIVVIAREKDKAGAGGSISSVSQMQLDVFEPEVSQEASFDRQFKLSDAKFTGRSGRGEYSQAGGAILVDQDISAPGGQRAVRIDRMGLEGVEIKRVSRPQMRASASTGKLEPVKDASGKDVMESVPEFRVSFGYDESTLDMVEDFGIKNGSAAYSRDELREIFSPDVVRAKINGKWRKGVTKKEKELYGKFQSISQQVIERIQNRTEADPTTGALNYVNRHVAVTLDPDQGGSVSGRTSIRWNQRKRVDQGAAKGGPTKQTQRIHRLPDNPEPGGEVDRYLGNVQEQLMRITMGDRRLERRLYQTDSRGNFLISDKSITDPALIKAAANEIDPSTGLYANRIIRNLSGQELEDVRRKSRKLYDADRKKAEKELSDFMHVIETGSKVHIGSGAFSGTDAVVSSIDEKAGTFTFEQRSEQKAKVVNKKVIDPVTKKWTGQMQQVVTPWTPSQLAGDPSKGIFREVDPVTGNLVTRTVRTEKLSSAAKIADLNDLAAIKMQQRIGDSRGRLNELDKVIAPSNPFGRWIANRERLNATEINSEFLEKYVGPISTLMSVAEQKTDSLFQQEVLLGAFRTQDPRFARARSVVRAEFGANDDDDVNILRTDDYDRLNRTMREMLKVSPRAFTRGEHPLASVDPAYAEAGLYTPVERVVDPVSGAVSYNDSEWKFDEIITPDGKRKVETENYGRIAFMQSSGGYSPEYTGLGRMTSEMLRMLYRSPDTQDLYEDLTNQFIDPKTNDVRPHVLHALVPDLMPNVLKFDDGANNPDSRLKLSLPGPEYDDDERFSELLNSWHAELQGRGLSRSTALELPAIAAIGETEGYRVASPDTFIGQERSAIGRAYFNLLNQVNSGGSVQEIIAARGIYESEIKTFFDQKETIKNALSMDHGVVTTFSRYVSDSSVADNEIVIGDDTVSIFAEQASRALGAPVSKEDVISAINSGEGMYGFAPRLPEVTEFITPFRFRYDAKNKSLPRVSEYFAMLYMGDNDADPLMMMLMGAFNKNTDGSIGYKNFRQVKDLYKKAPSGSYQAMARIRSRMNEREFTSMYNQAEATARKMIDYELDNNLLSEFDEQGRASTVKQDNLRASRDAYRMGAAGSELYQDTVKRYVMTGLFRGKSVEDASGNPVYEIEAADIETGRNRRTGRAPKVQNVEKERQSDLKKGRPSSIFTQLTGAIKHVFSSEEATAINKESEQIYKGMGIFTYLKSMTALWDEDFNNRVKEALGPGFVDPMEKAATTSDVAKGGTAQYSDVGKLARESTTFEYQRAIDLMTAEKNMEEASKAFFTSDVSDYARNYHGISRAGVRSLLESENINEFTAAALLGEDKDSIASLYKGILDYRAGRFAPTTSKEYEKAAQALNEINVIAANNQNSLWHRAMRARVLINTQDRINSGWYEQNKTVEQRQRLRNDWYSFLKNNPSAESDALEIGSYSRMRDSGNAIAGGFATFMRALAVKSGIDPAKLTPAFIRKKLGGKSIDEMSLEPGEADRNARMAGTVVNNNGITVTNRRGPGINASFTIHGGPSGLSAAKEQEIIRRMGGNKAAGEDFTPEELNALPISASQIGYLADPNGREHSKVYGSVEGEAEVTSSGLGLVNMVMAGLQKKINTADPSKAVPLSLPSEVNSRGMFYVAQDSLEQGTFAEDAIFDELVAQGKSPKDIAAEQGYRTKGGVFTNFYNSSEIGGVRTQGASIRYEPDVLFQNSKGEWEVRDIKATRLRDKNKDDFEEVIDPKTGEKSRNIYIANQGMWEGDLPGGYVTQQMFYVQAMNEFSERADSRLAKVSKGWKVPNQSSYVKQAHRYFMDIAKDPTKAGADQELIDLAKQYEGIHGWFTNSDRGAGLSDQEAAEKVLSIVKKGVKAGGVRYVIKDGDGFRREIDPVTGLRDGKIDVQDFDTNAAKFGIGTGFQRLAGMSRSEMKGEVINIRKKASDNRILRFMEDAPAELGAMVNASNRWNRDREEVLQEIKNSKAPIAKNNQEQGILSRELAALSPYTKTRQSENSKDRSKNITAADLVAAEEQFSKYGILNVGTTGNKSEYQELERITGREINKPDEALRERVDFRKLVAAAARRGKEKDIKGSDYVSAATAIAQFMGESSGDERYKALYSLVGQKIVTGKQAEAAFAGFDSNSATGTLTGTREDTSKLLYQMLNRAYGSKKANLMKEGRVLVDPTTMHATNLNKEDQERQGGFVKNLVTAIRVALGTPEGKMGASIYNRIEDDLAKVVDEKGNVIGSDSDAKEYATNVRQLQSGVEAGTLSGAEARSQYALMDIPTFANVGAPPVIVQQSVDDFRRHMSIALGSIRPDLSKRIMEAGIHELPALAQRAFGEIGTKSDYLRMAGSHWAPYEKVIESWNLASQSLNNPETVHYFSRMTGAGGTDASEFMPPSLDFDGNIYIPPAPAANPGASLPSSSAHSSSPPAASSPAPTTPATPSPIFDASGRVDVGRASAISGSKALTKDEIDLLEKNNNFIEQKERHARGEISAADLKKHALTKSEKAKVKRIGKKVEKQEAAAAGARAPAAPTATTTPAAASGTTSPAAGGTTSPGAATTPSAAGTTAPTPSISAGSRAFGGRPYSSPGSPDEYVLGSMELVGYLKDYSATGTINASGDTEYTYTSGLKKSEIVDRMGKGQIGTAEQRLFFNLNEVFAALENGQAVPQSDLNEAFDRMARLSNSVASSNMDKGERDAANQEINRVMKLLEEHGAKRTRKGIALENARAGVVSLSSRASSSARTKRLASGGSAPAPVTPGKASYLDITTEQSDLVSAIEQMEKSGVLLGGDKINTDEIHKSIRRAISSEEGALYRNQHLLRGDAGIINLNTRAGWDPSKKDEIVSNYKKYSDAAEGIVSERKKTEAELVETKRIINSMESAYLDKDRKFTGDENAKRIYDTLKITEANLSASLGEGGIHGRQAHEFAMARADYVVRQEHENKRRAQTTEIVEAEIAGGSFVGNAAQEVEDRLAGRSTGATGAGYTKEEREKILNEEYQSVRDQLKKGRPVIDGFFGEIKAISDMLRDETKSWVSTLSKEGQEATKGFLNSVNNAAKAMEEYAGLSMEDRADPKKAADSFRSLIEKREALKEEIEAVEANPTLQTKDGKKRVADAKSALSYIEQILSDSSEDSIAKVASKELGSTRVKKMLEEAGIDVSGDSSKKPGKEPYISLLGAHAAYQQFIAMKTGIDPFIQAVSAYEKNKAGVNAILSGAGLDSKIPGAAQIGQEARDSFEYRRGRESGRLGAITSDIERSGAFQAFADMFDVAKGAGIGLLPLYESISQFATESKKSSGSILKRMEDFGIAAVNSRDAFRKAGKVSMRAEAMGAVGQLAQGFAAAPAAPLIIAGTVGAAVASAGAHIYGAMDDEEGLAISREIAGRRGFAASIDAGFWSAIVAGNPYSKEQIEKNADVEGYFATVARKGAAAADEMERGENLKNSATIRSYLDYASLAGEWRDYSRSIGVDSGRQREAQALAASLFGERLPGKEYADVEKRLIMAQANGETASGAVVMAKSIASAQGKYDSRSTAKFLGIIEKTKFTKEEKELLDAAQSDVDNARVAPEIEDLANPIAASILTGAYLFNIDPDVMPAISGSVREARNKKRIAQSRIDNFKYESEWTTSDAEEYIGGIGKIGNIEDLDRIAAASGIAKEGEVFAKFDAIARDLARNDEIINTRQGEIISSSIVQNKLFEESLRSMGYDERGIASLGNHLGPMDSTIVGGKTYYAYTPSMKETGTQIASHAESIRQMRAEAGLYTDKNISVYTSELQTIKDSNGRAIGIERGSFAANTYQNFTRDLIDRTIDQYSLSKYDSFGSADDMAVSLGFVRPTIANRVYDAFKGSFGEADDGTLGGKVKKYLGDAFGAAEDFVFNKLGDPGWMTDFGASFTAMMLDKAFPSKTGPVPLSVDPLNVPGAILGLAADFILGGMGAKKKEEEGENEAKPEPSSSGGKLNSPVKQETKGGGGKLYSPVKRSKSKEPLPSDKNVSNENQEISSSSTVANVDQEFFSIESVFDSVKSVAYSLFSQFYGDTEPVSEEKSEAPSVKTKTPKSVNANYTSKLNPWAYFYEDSASNPVRFMKNRERYPERVPLDPKPRDVVPPKQNEGYEFFTQTGGTCAIAAAIAMSSPFGVKDAKYKGEKGYYNFLEEEKYYDIEPSDDPRQSGKKVYKSETFDVLAEKLGKEGYAVKYVGIKADQYQDSEYANRFPQVVAVDGAYAPYADWAVSQNNPHGYHPEKNKGDPPANRVVPHALIRVDQNYIANPNSKTGGIPRWVDNDALFQAMEVGQANRVAQGILVLDPDAPGEGGLKVRDFYRKYPEKWGGKTGTVEDLPSAWRYGEPSWEGADIVNRNAEKIKISKDAFVTQYRDNYAQDYVSIFDSFERDIRKRFSDLGIGVIQKAELSYAEKKIRDRDSAFYRNAIKGRDSWFVDSPQKAPTDLENKINFVKSKIGIDPDNRQKQEGSFFEWFNKVKRDVFDYAKTFIQGSVPESAFIGPVKSSGSYSGANSGTPNYSLSLPNGGGFSPSSPPPTQTVSSTNSFSGSGTSAINANAAVSGVFVANNNGQPVSPPSRNTNAQRPADYSETISKDYAPWIGGALSIIQSVQKIQAGEILSTEEESGLIKNIGLDAYYAIFDSSEPSKEYQSAVIQQVLEASGKAKIAAEMQGIEFVDYPEREKSGNLSWLMKRDRNNNKVVDFNAWARFTTRNSFYETGTEKVANALGFSSQGLNMMASNGGTAIMQLAFGASSGDPMSFTRMFDPRAMPFVNQYTKNGFQNAINEFGLRPMIDPITGGNPFERSMGGAPDPFNKGQFLMTQDQITPKAMKALFDPIRRDLFGVSQKELDGVAYDRLNKVVAGDVFRYTDPATGKEVKMGGLAGLQMESNLASYKATMASIGIQREQLEYNRERQLAWDFPVAATENEISAAQMLGGVVHTDWMKEQGLGPLDFSGGTVTTEGMEGTVTYEGGQIGQQKFNLAMNKIEARRGQEQNRVRMGWQQADLFREISRSRVRGDWQQSDFALQEEQMMFARQKQAYDFSFQAREMGISRQHYREDYAYGKRMREMQFGWQMEDSDTAIRRSTGFERKQLIKNKERETIAFNAETEQNERVNRRQEEAFKREEERFNKEIEHYKKSLKFEDEQFERQKERFEQQRKWEEEDYAIKSGRVAEEAAWSEEAYQRQLARMAVEEDLLKKQEANENVMRDRRASQQEEDMARATKMYELSKKSLDASAGAAAEQKRIADTQVIITEQQAEVSNAWARLLYSVNWEKMLGEIKGFVRFMGQAGYISITPDGNPEVDKEEIPNKSKAHGGKVSRGESYVVGELGAEILNIGKDGTPYILPNSAIPKDRSIGRAGQGEVIHIHVMMDSDEIATYTAGKANNMATRNRRRAFNG